MVVLKIPNFSARYAHYAKTRGHRRGEPLGCSPRPEARYNQWARSDHGPPLINGGSLEGDQNPTRVESSGRDALSTPVWSGL